MTVNKHPASVSQTGQRCPIDHEKILGHGKYRIMKPHKPIFIVLILGIPILIYSLVLYWGLWESSRKLTERELIALTNAVRVVSTKPIVRIIQSDTDGSAYEVINDSITDSVGQVEWFGLNFERGLFGWRFVKGSARDPQKYLAMREGWLEARKIQGTLVEGATFPDFDEKDVMDQPLSLSHFRGKVVLIDFWATWCVPCRAEVPHVAATFQKYHDQGFEIIGVSLDKDRKKLLDFTMEHKMAWQEYFDGKSLPWENKLASRYGIAHSGIPMDFLLDGNGKIIGKNLRGAALPQAVAKALTK
jgi:thiol-disulfide isomerase/thioredoxin